MLTGAAGCRMVTVCPGTPGAIWLATVWMTRLAAGMVANAMVGFSSVPMGRVCVRAPRGCGRQRAVHGDSELGPFSTDRRKNPPPPSPATEGFRQSSNIFNFIQT